MPDNVHINDIGHELIANKIQTFLESLWKNIHRVTLLFLLYNSGEKTYGGGTILKKMKDHIFNLFRSYEIPEDHDVCPI